MQSVNMWEKGRRTDGYRNKNRILGENLKMTDYGQYLLSLMREENL